MQNILSEIAMWPDLKHAALYLECILSKFWTLFYGIIIPAFIPCHLTITSTECYSKHYNGWRPTLMVLFKKIQRLYARCNDFVASKGLPCVEWFSHQWTTHQVTGLKSCQKSMPAQYWLGWWKAVISPHITSERMTHTSRKQIGHNIWNNSFLCIGSQTH